MVSADRNEAVEGDEENEMFTFDYQAVMAEDKYRREVLQDQGSKTSRTGKLTVLVVAAAMLVAACGMPPQVEAPERDVVAAVSDPGPVWQTSNAVAGIAVNSLGVFAGPNWRPNLNAAPLYFPDHGVFAGPSWGVSQAAIDEALGIDRDPGLVAETEPYGLPNYGRLETLLGNGGPTTGPR